MNSEFINRVLDLTIALQQIPAPTFNEAKRGQKVASLFRDEPLQDVSIDAIGNIYGRFPGLGHARPLVISAHLDTVFPFETPLQVQRTSEKIIGPGIGDNATGLAALFGLLWTLKTEGIQLPGDLWLVANVGEEGLGNLSGMQSVVQRFSHQPLAYIVLEGLAFGQIYHRALASERYHIKVETVGGHSWVDYGKPSAVHEIARLINQLLAVALPENPRTTLNVGQIHGGISVNTIAASAYLELDLRSEDEEILREIVAQVIGICSNADNKGVRVSIKMIGERPGGMLPKDHPLVEEARQCLQEQGIRPHLNIGSTDANVPLSLGYPAICIGITRGGGAHTLTEYIYTTPFVQGLRQLVNLVQRVYAIL